MKSKTSTAISCAVYSVAGAVSTLYFASFVLFDPRLFLAVLCAVAIIVGGVWTATNPERGRVVALAGTIGLMPICFFLIVALVPEHNVITSPFPFVTVGGYLVLFAYSLFFPRPYRFAWLAFAGIIVFAVGTYVVTYSDRLARGEYDRPTLECYRWDPTPADDLVISGELGTRHNQLVNLLRDAGIRGTVHQQGAGDNKDNRSRLILLAQAPFPLDTKLFFPRHGSLVYAFDGRQWKKFPADAATFPLYASFRDDNGNTMICGTRPDGGDTCFACLNQQP